MSKLYVNNDDVLTDHDCDAEIIQVEQDEAACSSTSHPSITL